MNQVTRETALEVVRRAAAKLQAGRESTAAVVHAACAEMGVEPAAFEAVMAADPDLEQLEVAAFDEALAGSTDPGPHGEISRESSSGKPGVLTKHSDQGYTHDDKLRQS